MKYKKRFQIILKQFN